MGAEYAYERKPNTDGNSLRLRVDDSLIKADCPLQTVCAADYIPYCLSCLGKTPYVQLCTLFALPSLSWEVGPSNNFGI